MRQELVDVSIKLQLIDKNNFHVVYSASSSAIMPGSARLSAKVLPILQFSACTQKEEMCRSPVLPYPHIHVQPCAGSHSLCPTHSHPWLRHLHMCSHIRIPRLPACGCPPSVPGHTGELTSSHRHTHFVTSLSGILYPFKCVCMFDNAFTCRDTFHLLFLYHPSIHHSTDTICKANTF